MLRNTSKKIILVSYFFSSKYETGGIRTQKFVKYLPGFGFEPIVITKRRTDSYIYNGRCIFLRTVPVNWPFHLEVLTWLPGLFLTCLKIIRNEKVEVLLFSCGPFSSAVVGLFLKKLYNLKLILDYRDYWTLSPYLPKIPRFNRILNTLQKPLEKSLLRSADRLILIQKTMGDRYKEAFPFLEEKTQIIFNGFDEEDIPKMDCDFFEKFTVLYPGNLHLDLNPIYPILFLEAIQKMKDEKLINSSNFQVLIIGEKFEIFDKKIFDLGISELVKCLGKLPHKEVIHYLRKSHLLLLIVETDGVITSKVFEYLATGKPLLALIKEGELMNFIQEFSPNPYIVTKYNLKDIITPIRECFSNPFLKADLEEKCQNFRRIFNRKELTKQLAETLGTFET